MRQTHHSSFDTITGEVGRWNTDIAAGWEAGLRGRQRVAGRLHDRSAPSHLDESQNAGRLRNWLLGRDKAMAYRSRVMIRRVCYVGTNAAGHVVGVLRGWSVRRGRIVSRLEKAGCGGDVFFYYMEGTEIVRTVQSGI